MDPPPVQYVTTSDGYSIAYGVCGAGVVVVELPVIWNHFSLQWTTGIRRAEFEGLASQFQLVLYDGRGQGLSDRGLHTVPPIEEFESDLDAVVGCLTAKRLILLGPSAFGLVAIQYAVHHPERVAGLILWNYADTPAFATVLMDMAEADWEYYLETTAHNGFPTTEASLVKEVLRETMNREDLLILSRTLRRTSVAKLLPRLKTPTLILASRSGARAGPNEEGGRRLASMIPRAQFRLMDGPSGGWQSPDGSPSPALAAIQEFVSGLPEAFVKPPPERIGVLSQREIEILNLVVAGQTNQQIADELVISLNTVRRHVSNIFAKTGAANRAGAAIYARDHGLA